MTSEIYIYILVMSAVTLAIRILPLTLIRTEIKNVKVRSFLYYVPYVTLAVMTFPAIIHATQSEISGAAALIFGIVFRRIFVSSCGFMLRGCLCQRIISDLR